MARPETPAAYKALSDHLTEAGYAFICPSPESQGRVVQKRKSDTSTANAQSAEDFFGWNLPCSRHTLESMLPETLIESLITSSIIMPNNDSHSATDPQYHSSIRVSNFYLPSMSGSINGAKSLYYIHSSYPASSDSVFFGPDTYLFLAFLKSTAHYLPCPPRSLADVCCGSGAGAIHLARTYPKAVAHGLDLNPKALRLGNVNAHLADVKVNFQESDLYAAIFSEGQIQQEGIDLIVSNPPYIASSTTGDDLPIYADGGAEFGLGISMRIVEEGTKVLSSNGVMMIYTGVAIPTTRPSHDAFLERLKSANILELIEYQILHPDMWPEEIGTGAYAEVCRIQAVGAVLRKR